MAPTCWPGANLQRRLGATTPFVYVAGLVLIVSSLPFTRPELVPLRPQDESPLAVLDFEMAFPDMRGVTAWAERQPANADSPLIEQYLAGQPLQRAAIVAGSGQILEQSSRALSAAGPDARVMSRCTSASTRITFRAGAPRSMDSRLRFALRDQTG